MGLHADRIRERDALARKVEKMRAELDVYTALAEQAGQVLADTPEDDQPDESGAGVSAGGEAPHPTVMVQDHA